MNKLNVEVFEDANAFATLRQEWQALYQTARTTLAARAANATPFHAWEWLSTWQQWLNSNRAPYLLCARVDEKLVGLLALGVETLPLLGMPNQIRKVSLLGAGFGGADYLDVLALPEFAGAVTDAFIEHLTQAGRFDILELDGLAADSPTVARLASRFAKAQNIRLRVEPRYDCPQIELNGDWPALLKQCKRGDNFKRRLRQAQKCNGFAYRALTQAAEAEAGLARFLALHEPRWAEHGGSDFSGHAALRAFHHDLVQRLAEAGLLRFEELWLEGKCVASIYGLDDGQQFCYYNSGYDQAWRHASPGLVLLGLSIEAACARGLTRYDFLRGDESYKFDWANTTRATVQLTLARRNAASMFLFAQQQVSQRIRDIAKTALPAPLAATLRNRARLSRRQQNFAPSNVTTPPLGAQSLQAAGRGD